MRFSPLLLLACLSSGSVKAADNVAVPIERVHLCCDECVEGVRSAVTAAGATHMIADQDTSRLVLFAPDTTAAQKAVKAMVDAGYFGRSRNPAVPVTADTGARDATVKNTEVEGVHLCCSSCVEQAKGALVAVPGVTSVAAATNGTTIQVKGEFNEKAALDALLDVGLSGKVSAEKPRTGKITP
jgi:periplasmic mercuric ion binding protein